jgi:hypothetical protein
MWSDVLTSGKREVAVEAGDQRLIIGRLPTTVRVPVGIADDHVNVGALLKFTRAEVDPMSEDEGSFAFEDDDDGEGRS